jgi:hypothetical protein
MRLLVYKNNKKEIMKKIFYPLFYYFCFFPINNSIAQNYSPFSDYECLNKNMDTTIVRSIDPFGILPLKLIITKDLCVIKIQRQKVFLFNKEWTVDVCRTPVHLKSGRLVIQKEHYVCPEIIDQTKKDESEYCKTVGQLLKTIQDDGLIFAEGEKEDLISPHGQLYCSYKLLTKHLISGHIFSRHENPSESASPSENGIPTSTDQSIHNVESETYLNKKVSIPEDENSLIREVK